VTAPATQVVPGNWYPYLDRRWADCSDHSGRAGLGGLGPNRGHHLLVLFRPFLQMS